MRILSILARYGTEKYPEALSDLRSFHRARLPSANCDVLVVDNAGGEFRGEPRGIQVIGGSNRNWEFSAWDEGLTHVGARIREYDLVHLVTSAFRTLYTRYIDRCDERTLGLIMGRRVALGHVDYYNEPVELLGNLSQCWIRSSFLFLPPTELAKLGTLVGVTDPAPFFSGSPATPFRADAPVSENYRRYVVDWLTGGGTGQGVTWHSRFALTSDTLQHFHSKALAIFNEHLLTIRLRRQGCAIVDATWLATQSTRRHSHADPIPDWREQLAGRDTDAIDVRRRH
jgi:hypothetical protein